MGGRPAPPSRGWWSSTWARWRPGASTSTTTSPTRTTWPSSSTRSRWPESVSTISRSRKVHFLYFNFLQTWCAPWSPCSSSGSSSCSSPLPPASWAAGRPPRPTSPPPPFSCSSPVSSNKMQENLANFSLRLRFIPRWRDGAVARGGALGEKQDHDWDRHRAVHRHLAWGEDDGDWETF